MKNIFMSDEKKKDSKYEPPKFDKYSEDKRWKEKLRRDVEVERKIDKENEDKKKKKDE